MQTWKETLLKPENTIVDAIRCLNETKLQLVMVVDGQGKLLGVVSDGDIRRAILKGLKLDSPVTAIMNATPTTATPSTPRKGVMELMRNKVIHRVPLLDQNSQVIGLLTAEQFFKNQIRENRVVLMAGGLGSRLNPLTETIPKPLLTVGGKPILETILANCIEHGLHRFSIAVNYKAEMIKEYFGDGSRWNVQIDYLEEKQPLGTAGALRLLRDPGSDPLFVMNADLLTNTNLENLLDFHGKNASLATMCVKEYDFQVPYGVIHTTGERIESIDEKPIHRFLVNAGIYVIDPKVISLVPGDQIFNMTDLFDLLLGQNQKTCAFPIHEYWLDIGMMKDFEQAQLDVRKMKK